MFSYKFLLIFTKPKVSNIKCLSNFIKRKFSLSYLNSDFNWEPSDQRRTKDYDSDQRSTESSIYESLYNLYLEILFYTDI